MSSSEENWPGPVTINTANGIAYRYAFSTGVPDLKLQYMATAMVVVTAAAVTRVNSPHAAERAQTDSPSAAQTAKNAGKGKPRLFTKPTKPHGCPAKTNPPASASFCQP